MSKREEGKRQRRQRIVQAAHDLISDIGVDAISMRRVADRADVSLSTLYNLFASKEAILTQVFSDAFTNYRQAVLNGATEDPILRFFEAVDTAAEFYEADAAFYKSLTWMIGRESELKLALQEPRFQFYCDLVQFAIDRGALLPDADARIVGTTIVPLYSFAFQTWAAGGASIDEFCMRAKFSIVVILKAFAVPAVQARLAEQQAILEGWLKAQLFIPRRKSVAASEPRNRAARPS